MSPAISLVLQALIGNDPSALTSAVRECRAIDERLADGESVLFHAVLSGRIEFVETMLAAGADPNFRAIDPADYLLTPTPLELAQQARFLMDWDKYHPIAVLLQAHGALDQEGLMDDLEQLKAKEISAKSWQAGRG